MRGIWLRLSLVPLGLCALRICWAQEPAKQEEPKHPALRTIRYEEDWSRLRSVPGQEGAFDALKWIPLGLGARLTIGGETRQRFELFHNDEWGRESPGFDGFYLQRYMLHADLHLGERIRLFGQLKSGVERGRELGPRPVDEDDLDVHQAFAEVSLGGKSKSRLRVGRQEVGLGSSRLVAIREGPNVRQSFDGARLLLDVGGWETSLLALRPARTVPGVFDDGPDHRQSFWGVYAVRKLNGAMRGVVVDLYYLGLDKKRARFESGVGREHRHSFGTRWSGRREGWDFDWEGVVQSGSFEGRGVRAWTVGSNTGYTFRRTKFQPRVGAKADVTSGDKDPGDRRLGTFNALYPRGNYFSQADLFGPYNLMDLHPGVALKMHRRLSVLFDADVFWRYSTRDAIYNVPGIPLVPGRASDARYVGTAVKAGTEWRWNDHLSFEVEYQRLFAGRFLQDQGRGKPIDFLAVWASFKF